MMKNTSLRTAEPATYQIRALERGLDLLEVFSRASPELPLADIAAAASLPKPTVTRLLSVLLDRRYVERVPDAERYRLGVKALELGSVYLQSTSLEAEAKPIMQRLAGSTNQTANLGVLDQFDVVHIQVVAPDRPVRFWAEIGKREDAYLSGLGKVLLSEMDDALLSSYLSRSRAAKTPRTLIAAEDLRAAITHAHADGYALDDEESNLGVCCIAAPVRDRNGATIAAISISGARAEFGCAHMDRLIHLVVQAAHDISKRLGYRDAGGALIADHRNAEAGVESNAR